MEKQNKKKTHIVADKESLSKALKEILAVPTISNVKLKEKFAKKEKSKTRHGK